MCFMQHYGLMTASASAGVADQTGRHNTESTISADLPKGISPFDLPDKNDEDFKAMWEQEQGDEMSKDSDKLLRSLKIGTPLICQDKVCGHRWMAGQKTGHLQHTKVPRVPVWQGDQVPWRIKGAANQILKSRAPGEVVFMDQLTVPTPGLISQISGFLTHARYHYTTVFLDHCSDCPYIVMQKGLTGEETIRAKTSYEGHARHHGVIIKHYHTDNGVFTGGVFQEDVRAQRQTMSDCHVGAHHPNGDVAKLIRDRIMGEQCYYMCNSGGQTLYVKICGLMLLLYAWKYVNGRQDWPMARFHIIYSVTQKWKNHA